MAKEKTEADYDKESLALLSGKKPQAKVEVKMQVQKQQPSEGTDQFQASLIKPKVQQKEEVENEVEQKIEQSEQKPEQQNIEQVSIQVDPREQRIAKLQKMLQELNGKVSKVGRSPEHEAYAELYPDKADKYQQLVQKATKFADDTVGRDDPKWDSIADKYLRAISGQPIEKKAEIKVQKKVVQGAKKPVGVSPISKPVAKTKPKSNLLSEEDQLNLLKPKHY